MSSNKENKKKSYSDGMRDAITLWGRVCGKQNACEDCPVMPMRSNGLTCQQMAQKFPNKFIPILMEMDKGGTTYYNEFCARFPECGLTVEELAEITCRKVVFEGSTNCNESMSCTECWMMKYEGDITDFGDETAQVSQQSTEYGDDEFIDDLPEALR